jgi:hypothetical protein
MLQKTTLPVKIIFLILVVLCSSWKIIAQGADYYSIVHAAEKNVIAENYKEAVLHYKEAFTLISPFLKDLHNALLCAVKANDMTSAKGFIDEYIHYDIDTHYLFRSEALKDLRANESLWAYTTSRLTIHRQTSRSDCTFFTRLFALDQSIRGACREINTNYYGLCGQEIKLLDSVILLQLENYFKTNEVPADIERCNTIPSSFPDYFLIINHNMQWGWNPLDSVLTDAVKKYKLHPLLYAHLADYFNESYLKEPAVYGEGYNIKLADRLFVFDVPEDLETIINESRKSIFLDPIEEYNLKVIFQYRHPEFYLIYPFLMATLDAGPEMEQELALKWKDIEVHKNE